MFPYTREIQVSGCNHGVSEWYPAYRDTPRQTGYITGVHFWVSLYAGYHSDTVCQDPDTYISLVDLETVTYNLPV